MPLLWLRRLSHGNNPADFKRPCKNSSLPFYSLNKSYLFIFFPHKVCRNIESGHIICLAFIIECFVNIQQIHVNQVFFNIKRSIIEHEDNKCWCSPIQWRCICWLVVNWNIYCINTIPNYCSCTISTVVIINMVLMGNSLTRKCDPLRPSWSVCERKCFRDLGYFCRSLGSIVDSYQWFWLDSAIHHVLWLASFNFFVRKWVATWLVEQKHVI